MNGMPPYSWIHLESAWWVLLGGALFALAIILARGSLRFSFSSRRRSEEELEQAHEFGADLKEHDRPLPLFIWVVLVAVLIWTVAYVIFTGARGL